MTLAVVTQAPAPADAYRSVDVGELEQFLDELLTSQLAEHNVAGAVVSVVQDGDIAFSAGYGYADIEARRPMDAERTLVRIGSTTKLFTATAVMQLVEEGTLDLDEDVNRYLDFVIPGEDTITLTHLLTHTAGFEDALIGYQQLPAEAPPRADWLAEHIPARVRPPGRYSAYSNYGMALAGYIVERMSAMPYEDYVEQHILAPLDMSNTTPRWPVPDGMAAELSLGYRDSGGGLIAADYQAIAPPVGPTGLISATADDMTRFVIAHLDEGAAGEDRILDPATKRAMHDQVFSHDDRVNGFAYGFYEMSRNGTRIIGHGGDTELFHSLVALFPEQQLGIFVSYNSATAFDGVSALYEDLLSAFVDEYFPADTPSPLSGPGSAQEVAGSYLTLRSNHSSVMKAIGLLSNIVISALDEHTIKVATPTETFQFVEIEPLTYQSDDGERVAFEQNEQGDVTHAFLNSDPTQAFEKLPWYRSAALHIPVLLIGLLGLVTVPLIAGAAWVGARRRGRSSQWPGEARTARQVLAANAALTFLLLAPYGAIDGDALMSGRTTTLVVVPIITIAMALLTVAGGIYTVIAWWHRLWRLPARLHYTAVTLTTAMFLVSAHSWNLIA